MKLQTSMTDGKILSSLLNFAIPMFISTLVQQLFVAVDSIIVGRYVGASGLAAIGVTSQIIVFTVSLGVGLLMGVSVVVSEYYGKGDFEMVRKAEVVAIYIILAAYSIKLVVALWLTEPILALTNTPDDVMDQAAGYLKITFYFGIFSYGYSMCIYILRACGDSLRPLFLLLFSAGLNVALDLIFVKCLHLGVEGAAAASMIAEGTALFLCLGYIALKKKELVIRREDFKEIGGITRYTLKLSLPSCAQVSAITLCTIFVQAVINKYGTYVVAGYAAAQKIEQIMILIATSLAGAMSTFVAQNRGAGKMDRISEGRRIVVRTTLYLSLVMSLFMVLFGKWFLGWFAEDGSKQIIQEGMAYLYITCGFYIFEGLAQVYSNILRGMADAFAPLLIGAMQVTANLAAIFLLEPLLGLQGIWISVVLSWLLCYLVSAVRIKRKVVL